MEKKGLRKNNTTLDLEGSNLKKGLDNEGSGTFGPVVIDILLSTSGGSLLSTPINGNGGGGPGDGAFLVFIGFFHFSRFI